jgi:hypothetical protein
MDGVGIHREAVRWSKATRDPRRRCRWLPRNGCNSLHPSATSATGARPTPSIPWRPTKAKDADACLPACGVVFVSECDRANPAAPCIIDPVGLPYRRPSGYLRSIARRPAARPGCFRTTLPCWPAKVQQPRQTRSPIRPAAVWLTWGGSWFGWLAAPWPACHSHGYTAPWRSIDASRVQRQAAPEPTTGPGQKRAASSTKPSKSGTRCCG